MRCRDRQQHTGGAPCFTRRVPSGCGTCGYPGCRIRSHEAAGDHGHGRAPFGGAGCGENRIVRLRSAAGARIWLSSSRTCGIAAGGPSVVAHRAGKSVRVFAGDCRERPDEIVGQTWEPATRWPQFIRFAPLYPHCFQATSITRPPEISTGQTWTTMGKLPCRGDGPLF